MIRRKALSVANPQAPQSSWQFTSPGWILGWFIQVDPQSGNELPMVMWEDGAHGFFGLIPFNQAQAQDGLPDQIPQIPG